MDNNNKWIKLFSKFTKWEWYKEQNTKDLFIHCLLKANWKDKNFEGIVIPRGSFITGRKKLAQELGMTEQQIRTALKHLILTNEITTKITNKYTIITVIKYEKYQQKKENLTNETTYETTNEQPTTNQQLTTIEEYIDNIDNYVCNNNARAREKISCHLGSLFKNESCFYCMKKKICQNPPSSDFKFNHPNENFEQWDERKNELYNAWCEMKKNSNNEESFVFDDDSWLYENEN